MVVFSIINDWMTKAKERSRLSGWEMSGGVEWVVAWSWWWCGVGGGVE